MGITHAGRRGEPDMSRSGFTKAAQAEARSAGARLVALPALNSDLTQAVTNL